MEAFPYFRMKVITITFWFPKMPCFPRESNSNKVKDFVLESTYVSAWPRVMEFQFFTLQHW